MRFMLSESHHVDHGALVACARGARQAGTACAILAMVAGCAAPGSGRVVSIYASEFDALAVSNGHFGAVPLRLVPAAELDASTLCTRLAQASAAQCVRHASGLVGWVVAAEWRAASLAARTPVTAAPASSD